MTPTAFRELVLAYLRVTRGSETSVCRTPAHNVKVGGVPFSAHQVGLAVDVVYDAAPTKNVRQEWARRLGLVIIFEDDHDHLQPHGWRAG